MLLGRLLLLLLEALQARLHLRELRARPFARAVLTVVELALLLRDQPLAGGDRLAAGGELVTGAEEELLGVAQLGEPSVDLREPRRVRVGRGQALDLCGAPLQLALPLGQLVALLLRAQLELVLALRELGLTRIGRLLTLEEGACATLGLEGILAGVGFGVGDRGCRGDGRP